jgi:hypothetical protein
MYLRDGLPIREREVLADFQIKSPENGARLSGPTPFRCDILARRAVIEVQVFVNGKLLRRWDEEELPVPGAQAKAGYFVCPVRVDGLEAAQPGTNTIRILANIAGQWASRTLVVEREGVEAEALGPGGEELGLGTGGQTTLAGAIHDDDRKR